MISAALLWGSAEFFRLARPAFFSLSLPLCFSCITMWETLSFFVWRGASLFSEGAGLLGPAPSEKRRATKSKRKNSAFP